MKIATITEDGINISQHFGRAPYYVVISVEDGKCVKKETRNKAGHHSFGGAEQHSSNPGERHGFDADAQSKHAIMAQPLSDCQLLIAGGMGWGAHESLKRAGIAVHMTDVKNIDEAISLYLQGKLPNLEERLH